MRHKPSDVVNVLTARPHLKERAVFRHWQGTQFSGHKPRRRQPFCSQVGKSGLQDRFASVSKLRWKHCGDRWVTLSYNRVKGGAVRTGVGVAGRQRRLVSFTLEFVHLKHYHVSAMRRICSHFLDTSSVVFQDSCSHTAQHTPFIAMIPLSFIFSMEVVPKDKKKKKNQTKTLPQVIFQKSFFFSAYSLGALTIISGNLCQQLCLT